MCPKNFKIIFRAWGFAMGLALLLNSSIYFHAEADINHEGTLSPKLLKHYRISLHMGLCSVAFEEDFMDQHLADRYLKRSIEADALIQAEGWSPEEVLQAHGEVMEKEFSFTLPAGTEWAAYRKAFFDEAYCEKVYSSMNSD